MSEIIMQLEIKSYNDLNEVWDHMNFPLRIQKDFFAAITSLFVRRKKKNVAHKFGIS